MWCDSFGASITKQASRDNLFQAGDPTIPGRSINSDLTSVFVLSQVRVDLK